MQLFILYRLYRIIIFYSLLYIFHFLSLQHVSSSLSLEHSQSHLSQQWFIFSGMVMGPAEWVKMVVWRRGPGEVGCGSAWGLIEWVEIVEQWRSTWFVGFDRHGSWVLIGGGDRSGSWVLIE